MGAAKRWHAAAGRHPDAVGFSLLGSCAVLVGLLYMLGPLSGAPLWLPTVVLGLVAGYAGYLLKVLPAQRKRGDAANE